ncbi:MAG: PKD domain-containing protein [Bacteroidia bacterium]
MLRTKYILIILMMLLGANLSAQTIFNLRFANALPDNGQYCLDVEMSFDSPGQLGTSNLVFTYNDEAVSNPTIETTVLSSPLVYQVPSLTTPSNELASINIVLNAATFGHAIANTPTKIFRICFDIVDVNEIVNLDWVVNNNAATVVFEDETVPVQLSAGILEDFSGSSQQAPVAAFTLTPNNGSSPLPVQFDASTSYDPDGSISSYAWDFGDGNTATGLTPINTYTLSGNYSVRLVVIDNNGNPDTAYQSLTILPPNSPPVANFIATPSAGPAPLLVSLDASSSTDDAGIVSYSWDFGDGSTASGQNIDHTYTTPGTYILSLIVSDQEGLTDLKAETIVVEAGACFLLVNGEVVIEAENFTESAPGTGGASGSTWLSYSDVTASNGLAMRAEPNTGAYTGLNLNGPRLDYDIYFDTPGTYYVFVRASAPSENDDSFHAGLNGQAVTNQTGIGMHRVGAWAWAESANNGIAVQIVVPSTGKHTFNLWMREDGVQLDKIIVKAVAGGPSGLGPVESNSGSCGSGPGNQAPVAAFSPSTVSGVAPLATIFDASASSDFEGPIVSYAWDFGDGTLASGQIANHSFTQAGLYTVTLTVTDQGGLTDTETEQIQVNNDPNGASCFDEVGGQVVIEAENFSAFAPGTGNATSSSWQSFADGNASNGTALRAQPNTGVGTGNNLNGPRLDYDINFNTLGLYRVYVRSGAPTGNDDSYHIGIDGQALTNLSGYGMGGVGAWAWKNSANGGQSVEINITSVGKHTLSLWMREDGVEVDKIVIAQVSTPSGNGPIESALVSCNGSANQAPTASFTASATVGFAPLLVSVDASGSSDLEGAIASYSWDFGDGAFATGVNADHTYTNAGNYTLTLTVTDADGLSGQSSQLITVSTPGGGPLCFTETNGVVVMEAENYAATVAGTGNSAANYWETYADASASGNTALRAVPNQGSYTGLNLNGPRLDYEITFNTPGVYRVYVRAGGPSNADDSYHAGLNGTSTTNTSGYGMGSAGAFEWDDVANSTAVIIDVPVAGQHTFNLWMREDGVEIDKIVLLKQAAIISGTGPAESNRADCNQNAAAFFVQESGSNAEINWGNFYQEFKDIYMLERSFDGSRFELLEESEIIVDEPFSTYLDASVLEQEVSEITYRLSIRDAFGQVRESRIAILKLQQTIGLELIAYPNPVNKLLSLKYNFVEGESLQLRVLSATGQTVFLDEIPVLKADGTYKLDVSDWATGIYFVQLVDEKNDRVLRVMVY